MGRLVFLLLLFIICYSGTLPLRKEQVILDRIEYIFNLKELIDREIWDGFADKKFDLPLIYYTDSVCYVANPTKKFIDSFKPKRIFEGNDLNIYKTKLLDKTPFHMETSITFGDTSSAYNHKSPFMNCSSFEITQKTIPDVNSTEIWSTMVLHEYFHGFQLNHSTFLKYFERNIIKTPADTLKKIYQSQKWFKSRVDKENQILLAALRQEDEQQVRKLIDSFFVVRDLRRLQVQRRLKFDIRRIERTFETMEGTARYVEYCLYNSFSIKSADDKLLKSDAAYQSYQYFRNYSIEKDKWLYMSDKTPYFYATGFNMMRLIEKLQIMDKIVLFKKADLSLEQMLKMY